ncbi:MAG: caspase family protein, partial [Gammaproteobacteria bacterium]|nr:caspase family protein [Gammaproteobacteria bacterium]
GRKKNPHAVAVIIGNQRYAAHHKGIGDVRYAERDAAVMKKYLVKTMGYASENILFRPNASLVDFIDLFGRGDGLSGTLYNYLRKGRSDVFIYYVGHGAPHPQGSSSFLVPVNASVDNIINNGYELEKLYSLVERLPARSVTLVIDACFSGDSAAGSLYKNISPALLKSAVPVREVDNTVVFAGAGRGEVATWYRDKSHSTFTYYFLKGLGGQADVNGDGSITVAEMGSYLREEVPYRARREAAREQNPLIKGKGSAILARLR